MSRYNKDIFEKRIHGKTDLKVGTSGSSGFEESDTGNAISASYFFGDGSGLSNVAGGSTVNSFSTIAVSGQSNVVADSSTDTLTLVAGSNVTIATNAGTDSITINAAGGGGGTTFDYWMVDAPPNTANSLDDEFSGSLSGWSTFDPGSSGFASTTTNNRLVLSQNTFSGDRNAGIYKNAPTASSGDYEYAFWTKASWVSGDDTNFPICHIWIAEDAAGDPNNTDLWTIGVIRESNAFRTHAQHWNSYGSYDAGANKVEYIYSQSSYLRIRVSYAAASNTTTFSFDKSNNGEGWYQMVSRTYTGHLKHIGAGINNVGGSTEFYGLFDFFRVYDSADFFYFPSGSNVEITKAS
jgi:hypothetical protein